MKTETFASNKAPVFANADVNTFTEFLNNNLKKLFRNWYFFECYPDCKTGNCPAYYIKTYGMEPEKRQHAIQYYTNKLIDLFQKCPAPSDETVAMYIPSSNKDTFSNCGRVVAATANAIPWLQDGTKSIIRTSSIEPSHINNDMRHDHTRHTRTLDITMDLTNKNVILFDDRCTSGSSARQVIDLLYKHGAKHVWFIAFVVTDRRIFIVENQSRTKTSDAKYIGRFILDCKDYTFDLWPRYNRFGKLYHHGHVRDAIDTDIRILNAYISPYGYMEMNGTQYAIHLSKQEYSNNVCFTGIISDAPTKTSTEFIF